MTEPRFQILHRISTTVALLSAPKLFTADELEAFRGAA